MMNSSTLPASLPPGQVPDDDRILIVNQPPKSHGVQTGAHATAKPNRTQTQSNSRSTSGSGAGFCRVRRTSSGLEVGLARPKGLFTSKKTSPKVNWVPFTNVVALANTDTMQRAATVISKQLTRGDRGIAVAQAIGRALSSMRWKKQSALVERQQQAWEHEGAGDQFLSASRVWAQMLEHSGLLAQGHVVAAANQRDLFSGGFAVQLALVYAHTAMALAEYFDDTSLKACIPTSGALAGLAEDKSVRKQAFLSGCLTGAVAAAALEQHLPLGMDLTVLTRFKVQQNLTHKHECESWNDRAACNKVITEHETGKAELYVDVVDSKTGASALQFPVAYATLDRLVDLRTGRVVDDKSVNTFSRWPKMAAALGSVVFRRCSSANFSQTSAASSTQR